MPLAYRFAAAKSNKRAGLASVATASGRKTRHFDQARWAFTGVIDFYDPNAAIDGNGVGRTPQQDRPRTITC